MRHKRSLMACAVALMSCVVGAGARPVEQTSTPQPVTLKGSEGVTLKASYFAAGKPGPGILLMHACNRDRGSWTRFAEQAASRGFHVLTLDFRGFGESGGERFAPSPQQQWVIDNLWPADVDAAFAWLTAQNGVDKSRIAAAGASCGVNQSVQLAKRHPEVKTVVLLSGGVNAGAREYLRDSPWLPILGSASHGDGGAVQTMKWVLGWSRNPDNKFVEYKAAGHGTDMFDVEKGLEPLMLEWFETRLRNAKASVPSAAPAAKPTLVEEFWTALTSTDGVARAKKIYDTAKERKSDVVLFPEAEMNQYGYNLLTNDNNAKDALVVFQMNAEAYPSSANTYDSVSDAYLALGDKAAALAHAEKAMQMLEKDTEAPPEFKKLVRESAEKKIKELKR